MTHKDFNFWEVVEKLGWKQKCKEGIDRPYEETAKVLKEIVGSDAMLGTEISKTARAYRTVLVDKIREYSLKEYGNRYKFPRVGDDTFWDLTAHVVGCGKNDYERVFNDPKLIENYLRSYKENFEYTFSV